MINRTCPKIYNLSGCDAYIPRVSDYQNHLTLSPSNQRPNYKNLGQSLLAICAATVVIIDSYRDLYPCFLKLAFPERKTVGSYQRKLHGVTHQNQKDMFPQFDWLTRTANVCVTTLKTIRFWPRPNQGGCGDSNTESTISATRAELLTATSLATICKPSAEVITMPQKCSSLRTDINGEQHSTAIGHSLPTNTPTHMVQ